MNGKGGHNSKITKKEETDQKAVFNYVVSEGSQVLLDARDFVKDIDTTNSIKNYSWKPAVDTHLNIDDNIKNDKSIISFTAPYIKDNEINTILSFKLTIADKDGEEKNSPHNVDVVVKRVHRAIIFQGGVALGAYEAGAYRAIVEKIIKNDKDGGRNIPADEKRPLFDIVAGTSIGAMNAAIVVSSVTEKDGRSIEDPVKWQESSEKVVDFWKTQQQFPTYADFLDMNPFYHNWWDVFHDTSKVFKQSFTELIESYSNIINPDLKKWYEDTVPYWSFWEPSFLNDYIEDGWYIPATAESARRYYSAKQFHQLSLGPLHVASGIRPWSLGGKFLDFSEQSNWIPRPDNKHYVLYSLKRTLERFARFPINTSVKENQPRLLLVTVDVKTGDAVTFDSYIKEAKYHDDRNTVYNHDGIRVEHALASGAFPDFFDYPKFKVNMKDAGNNIIHEEHIFWDGGFRSNTPLRELVQAHRDYWLFKAREKHKGDKSYEYENDVPDLEVYIADLWPSELKEEPISFDRDFIQDRQWDLILSDKTSYDEQVSNVVTDYIDLARRLKNLAKRSGVPKEEIDYILDGFASSINTKGKTRRFKELLEGRFRLTKVVRIDRKDDGNDVHDKVFDYSFKTIAELMDVGYQDASMQMDLQRMKDGVMKLVEIHQHIKSENGKQIEDIQENLYQIQEMIKMENGYNTELNNQLKNFINEVESIKLNGNAFSLTNEKISLIAVSKQLQHTLKSRNVV